VSFHHLNRINAHLDFSLVSPAQISVLKEIAGSINHEQPSKYRISLKEIARRTGFSYSTVSAAKKALLDLGLLSTSKRKYGSQAYLYEVLIGCDCQDAENRSNHLSPYELEHGEAVSEPVENPAQYPTVEHSNIRELDIRISDSRTTYRQTNRDLKDLGEVVSSSKGFGLAEWENLLERAIRNAASAEAKSTYLAIKRNASDSLEIALRELAKNEWVTNPKAWLNVQLEKRPEAFLDGQENPDFRAKLNAYLDQAKAPRESLDKSPALDTLKADFRQHGTISYKSVLEALKTLTAHSVDH
jgi:DNA-binding Lrp family transcriptional regulator